MYVKKLGDIKMEVIIKNCNNIKEGYTDLLHLLILNNLQNTNTELIEENVPQNERLVRLNNSAK